MVLAKTNRHLKKNWGFISSPPSIMHRGQNYEWVLYYNLIVMNIL